MKQNWMTFCGETLKDNVPLGVIYTSERILYVSLRCSSHDILRILRETVGSMMAAFSMCTFSADMSDKRLCLWSAKTGFSTTSTAESSSSRDFCCSGVITSILGLFDPLRIYRLFLSVDCKPQSKTKDSKLLHGASCLTELLNDTALTGESL